MRGSAAVASIVENDFERPARLRKQRPDNNESQPLIILDVRGNVISIPSDSQLQAAVSPQASFFRPHLQTRTASRRHLPHPWGGPPLHRDDSGASPFAGDLRRLYRSNDEQVLESSNFPGPPWGRRRSVSPAWPARLRVGQRRRLSPPQARPPRPARPPPRPVRSRQPGTWPRSGSTRPHRHTRNAKPGRRRPTRLEIRSDSPTQWRHP